ncbi:hypothetical protein Tco_0374379 [Tanacetum coccineum]
MGGNRRRSVWFAIGAWDGNRKFLGLKFAAAACETLFLGCYLGNCWLSVRDNYDIEVGTTARISQSRGTTLRPRIPRWELALFCMFRYQPCVFGFGSFNKDEEELVVLL